MILAAQVPVADAGIQVPVEADQVLGVAITPVLIPAAQALAADAGTQVPVRADQVLAVAITRALTHDAPAPPPTVAVPILVAPNRAPIARAVTLVMVDRVADALRRARADAGRVRVTATTRAPILAVLGRAPIMLVATLVAQGRLAIDRVLIPTPPGPRAAGYDGRLLVVDGPGPARGVAGRAHRVHIEPVTIVPTVTVVTAVIAPIEVTALIAPTVALAGIMPAPRVAARPRIPGLQLRRRRPASLIRLSKSPAFLTRSWMRIWVSLSIIQIPRLRRIRRLTHVRELTRIRRPTHMRQLMLIRRLARILPILPPECPRLLRRSFAHVGPRPLRGVAVGLAVRMLRASACRRCYRAQDSRRVAKRRTGFAPAVSLSTANPPYLALAYHRPTRSASTVGSFVNVRRVVVLPHLSSIVRPARA